jgi:hypothetical protein
MVQPQETLRSAEGRFSPGQSGNPAGRPKGSRNKATLVAEALLEEATGPVVAQAIETALAGDGPMLRTLVHAIFPKSAGRSIELAIPEGRWGDPVVFLEATMRAVALGDITPQEATLLARLASVMVQAQRMKLRIEQFQAKAKPVVPTDCDPGVDPATHVDRSEKGAPDSSDGSAARVDGRDNPRVKAWGHDVACGRDAPVFGLYPNARPADAPMPPVSSRAAGSSIAPVNSRGHERRKAA